MNKCEAHVHCDMCNHKESFEIDLGEYLLYLNTNDIKVLQSLNFNQKLLLMKNKCINCYNKQYTLFNLNTEVGYQYVKN